MGKLIGGGVLLAALVIAYFIFRGDSERVSAESKYDGVHLCSPSQREAQRIAGGPPTAVPILATTPTPRPTALPEGVVAPALATTPWKSDRESPLLGANTLALFAQNDPTWGAEEYDHGKQEDVGCGTTISECGCAMTSVATVLSLFQVVTTPDGTALNPSTLNGWFNAGAKLTNAGWISQGYVFGSVVWTAANNFKSAATDEGGAPINVRFTGWGNGSEQEVRSELEKGHPVVLEVPGHYIAAVGLQGDEIIINDPYYKNRTTLSAYTGRVKSSRKYEPSNDLRAIMLTVPGGTRVQITDSQGRIVGTLSKGTPSSVVDGAKKDIAGASYHFEDQWRDPTCTERPPADGAGVNTIFLPFPESGTYHVRAINQDGNQTTVAIHTYDVNGNVKVDTREGGKDISFDFDYESGVVAPPVTTPTPTPSVSPTASATPSLTPTPPPNATATPTTRPSTPTPTTVPPTNTPTRPTSTPTATLTPTVTPTYGPVVRIMVAATPSTIICNGSNQVTITATTLDANGNVVPINGQVLIEAPGFIFPSVIADVANGQATGKVVPVGHAGFTAVSVRPYLGNTRPTTPVGESSFTCIFQN